VNPFDWPGPQFLAFYFMFGVGLLLLMRQRRHQREDGEIPKVDVSDPYLIAALRGGEEEALRVAAVHLYQRDLLAMDGDKVKLAEHASPVGFSHPVEKAVARYFQSGGSTAGLLKDAAARGSVGPYLERFKQLKLLPDRNIQRSRTRDLLYTCLVLWTVAGVKIAVAMARGRSNTGFLVTLAVVFALAGVVVTHPRLTSIGSALVKDLRTLFAQLKHRPSGKLEAAPSELALLAAVFGLSAVPAIAFPDLHRLFPRAASSGSSSSCGSGCGSSCGGGCGGGCGGCGG